MKQAKKGNGGANHSTIFLYGFMYLLSIDEFVTTDNAWYCVRDLRVRTSVSGSSCELDAEFLKGPVLFQGTFESCYAFAAGFGIPIYKFNIKEYTSITKAARARREKEMNK